MIKQILVNKRGGILGLSDNGELYFLTEAEGKEDWSHICFSPDDTKKPYFDGEWKTRNTN